MLNGIDPLLIIVLKVKPPVDVFAPAQVGILADLLDVVGVPIPIYLSERPLGVLGSVAPGGAAGRALAQSGIYVDNESRSIDVTTDVEGTTALDPLSPGDKKVEVSQTYVDSQLTISMVASRDSILLTAMTVLMEMIVKRLVSKEYEIHYLNGPTALFGGLLHRFATSVSRNDDLIRVELTLSTAKKKSNPAATAAATQLSVPKVAGALPL